MRAILRRSLIDRVELLVLLFFDSRRFDLGRGRLPSGLDLIVVRRAKDFQKGRGQLEDDEEDHDAPRQVAGRRGFLSYDAERFVISIEARIQGPLLPAVCSL